MELEQRFDAWYFNQTVVHPVGVLVLAALCLAILILPRNRALLPLLVLASIVPSAQRIVVAGLDFNFVRILVMVGWVRVLVRREYRDFTWTPLDYAFLAFWLCISSVYVIREHTPSALIWRTGLMIETMGIYFLTRFTLRGWQDLARLAHAAAIVSIPTAFFFAIEWATARNMFSIMGGVPEYTVIREGRLRCQGSFQHPIIAGIFWATLLPLIAARWWHPHASRFLVGCAVTCTLFIIAACSSSTPVLGTAAMLIAAGLFPIRFRLRWVRWALVIGLLALQVAMKAPVWALIARVGVIGGSTGYHRYLVINSFVNRFSEWWLMGTRSTAHWGHSMTDLTNVYVATGVHGGLISLLLFIALITIAFRQTGLTLRAVRTDRTKTVYAWALGLCLFTHVVVMMAASYFGEILIAWFITLAAIASVTAATQAHAPALAPVTRSEPNQVPSGHVPAQRALGGLARLLRSQDPT